MLDFNKIESIDFDNYFKNIINNDHVQKEFFGKSGTEHYRLLSYISTLFNGINIIDIGTHLGSSALALSYNSSNVVHSFDIVNKVTNEHIKNKNNIIFHYDNLFIENVSIDLQIENLILNSPLIFLDVDPHNGHMETYFYNYLMEKDYKGLIICDDIWYFKEMRDNFWYKIPPNNKYDVTEYGHWSGTGLISKNLSKYFSFPLIEYNNDWTLVTAYFNLTKCPDASPQIYSKEHYMNSSISTLSLPYNLIVYCDEESYDILYNIRPKFLYDKTKFIIRKFSEFSFVESSTRFKTFKSFKSSELHPSIISSIDSSICTFDDYREKIIENRRTHPYNFDQRNTASYYLFCMSRYAMLKETILSNPFKSTHFAWINICIERIGYKNLIHLDEALKVHRNKFSTCYIDYIPNSLIENTNEYFQYGRCSMCSGFFTGNAEYMYKACDEIENKFIEYLDCGYGHADEQLYSPVYFKNRDIFEHYYGDYKEMITNYVYVYDKPQSLLINFIRNSFNSKDYIKCNEGCQFLLRSVLNKKCYLSSNEYLHLLYYINSLLVELQYINT